MINEVRQRGILHPGEPAVDHPHQNPVLAHREGTLPIEGKQLRLASLQIIQVCHSETVSVGRAVLAE